jgi:hypothetical protein
MSYVIRPREVFGVVAATVRDQAVLHETLDRASTFLAAAAEGDHGAPAVVAELASLRAEHDRLTALQQTRVDRADHGVRAAVAAYRAGDEQTAEAFARSSAVLFGGPTHPPGVVGRYPIPVEPLPDVLEGP